MATAGIDWAAFEEIADTNKQLWWVLSLCLIVHIGLQLGQKSAYMAILSHSADFLTSFQTGRRKRGRVWGNELLEARRQGDV